MALDTTAIPDWSIKGELILNCNCTVFCPCVVSLGLHPPTEGYCQAWMGVRIDEGAFGDEDLSGLNIGMILDIPGNMSRGNWKVAAYIDERASDAAYDGLVSIFEGSARGTTGLFRMLVSEFLGAERAPVAFETEGTTRRLMVGKKIQGEIVPVTNAKGDETTITATDYWMGSDITVAKAAQSRVRAHGRVWDFNGRSAEICQIDWRGPN
ncbi:MAG: DUF1326 domain-containing protein [Pseudomonadota bacterium]